MEWIKFDLHQHTENELPTDRSEYKSNYTHNKFRDLLISQDVKLKAVTNHNVIDIVAHIKYALICDNIGVSYLPGVEIDYKFDDVEFHAISILNPEYDIIKYAGELNKIVDKIDHDEKITLSKDDFANLHQNIEYIFIPHYIKTKGIRPSQNNVHELVEDWVFSVIRNGHSIPVILENTQDYHKYSTYSAFKAKMRDEEIEIATYTGSDFKFDNDIFRKESSNERVKYKMNTRPTYRGLEIAVRNYDSRVLHEDDVITKENYIEEIIFLKNDKFKSNDAIKLSPGLNVIVGSSGSGKTLLLNEIYHELNDDHLSDVKESNNYKGNRKAPYQDIRGTTGFLSIKQYSTSKLKSVEIPNVYNEILKYTTDPTHLGELFEISEIIEAEKVFDNFRNEVGEYQDGLKRLKERSKAGRKLFDQLESNINFIQKNKLSNDTYMLSENVNENVIKIKLQKDLEEIGGVYAKQEDILQHFDKIQSLLDLDEGTKIISEIKDLYTRLIVLLKNKQDILFGQLRTENINNLIISMINGIISSKIDLLGLREKEVKLKVTQLETNKLNLFNNIKEILKINSHLDNKELVFPYNQIQESLQEHNSSQVARYQLLIDEESLKDTMISDIPFVNTSNIITKLKRITDSYDLFVSKDVKKMIESLEVSEISFKNILGPALPLMFEMKINETEWMEASNINPGTIARISMKYYFESIIRRDQPNVIFIDQPENDLDKDFLTNVLSDFLREKKMTCQIIITSHDPILTVNSDVNVIIESSSTEDGKFGYESYKLEDTIQSGFSTDRVAKILDGSINNVKNRYQIYGGMIRNENKNI